MIFFSLVGSCLEIGYYPRIHRSFNDRSKSTNDQTKQMAEYVIHDVTLTLHRAIETMNDGEPFRVHINRMRE